MNSYQHAKNQAILSFRSRSIVDLKILQSRNKYFPNVGFVQEFSKLSLSNNFKET